LNQENLTLPTFVGHAEWGDNRFRGHSIARDLAGHESVAGLFAMAIAGRRLDPSESALLDDLATVIIVADPRVWPLKLVRVVSSYGGSLGAVAAATVCFQGARVGHPTAGLAAELLVELERRLRASPLGETDERALDDECHRILNERDRLFGFGVPFRNRDERLDMLIERVTARGRSNLCYWQLFTRVAATLRRIKNLEPNVGLGLAAACLDIGFAPSAIGPLVTALGSVDFWSNAVEGATQAPPILRALPESCVRYVGPAARATPPAT
jgi:hypothetical protein